MSETNQTKICPHCDETIRAAAKVCPHCRYWQKKWSLYNPKVLTVLGVVVMTGYFIGIGIFMDQLLGPKHDFAKFRDQIVVVNSQVSHRMWNSNLWVTVVGIVTNRSEFGWKNVGIEAQFFDRSDKLIDTIAADADYRGFAVLPYGEAAFKIEGKATKLQSEYASHKVFIRVAKDIGEKF